MYKALSYCHVEHIEEIEPEGSHLITSQPPSFWSLFSVAFKLFFFWLHSSLMLQRARSVTQRQDLQIYVS